MFPILWLVVVGSLLIGAVARLGLWIAYAGPTRGIGQLWPALLQGVRYDLSIGSVAALALLLACLPLLSFRRDRAAERLGRNGAVFALVLFAFLTLCEHFYYGFYKNRFDPIVFGLFEDDTCAVLQTIWHDYPVLWMSLGLVLLGWGLAWSLARADAGLRRRWPRPRRDVLALLLGMVQCALLLVLARGSVGTFPLVRRDVTFSQDPFVNALVLNAPVTLYRATRARAKETDIGADPLAGLHRLGFRGPKEAALAAGISVSEQGRIADALFATVPGKPRPLAQSPHVVLAVLESFGADLLRTDGAGNDLLGRLRGELAYGYRFDNFIAGQNGTHPTLENLLLGSPITPLTLGRNALLRFDSAAALPFKRAGYRAVFIYGGGSDWRDIGKALRHQGFDQVFDARDIRQHFPEANGTEWGIYDAYLFKFAEAELEAADVRGERLFMVLLTTTNHPPYVLDTAHRALPLDASVMGPRAEADRDELSRTLATYQYQADQFGTFLKTLRESAAGGRTIVAAAGDHNLRTHYRYDLPAEQPDVDRVFAYLRVPAAFAPPGVPDTRAWCGHDDLVPTLVSLALPGARYFATGRNLWLPDTTGGEALAQFERLYTPSGMLSPLEAPLLYPWVDANHLRVQGRQPAPAQLALARKSAARVALRDWYIRLQARSQPAD